MNAPATRRAVLAGAGLMAFAGSASATLLPSDSAVAAGNAAHSDSDLLAYAAEYEKLDGRFAILAHVQDWKLAAPEKAAWEAEEAAILARQGVILAAMSRLSASTFEGLTAKARMLGPWLKEVEQVNGLFEREHELAQSLLADLLAKRGAA
jgi:hypothetical protein